MQVHIMAGWVIFCVAFAIMLITSLIMGRLSRHFFTIDVVERKFSILDLQLLTSPMELYNIIKGLYVLPEEKKDPAIASLKSQLYVDFIFMPATYGAIFLLCMKISWAMTSFGTYFFAFIAWLQIIPFVLDIIENIYLLNKIKPTIANPLKMEDKGRGEYKAYLRLELFKWGIALTSAICAFSAIMYIWLKGRYEVSSLKYLLIIAVEIALYFLILSLTKEVPQKAKVSND